MMSPAIILYSFMNFVEKNNYEKINILIFTFISLLFFLSLTLILGLIFGLLVIFIFGLLKKNNSKIFVIMPVVLSLIILLSIQNCWGRLYQTLNLNILYDKIPENSNIIKISKKLNALKLYLVQDKEFKTSEEIKKSLGTIRKLQDNIDILEVNLSKTIVEVKFNILKDMLITIDDKEIKKLIYEIENLKMEIEKKDLSTTTKFVMENEKIKKIHIKIDQKIKMILDYVNNEIESEIISSIDKISKNKQIENIKANILENKKLIKTLQNDYGKRDRFFLDETINVSTIVHLNHYMIAFDSIRSNFLGWGFQNYKSAAIQHAKNAKMIETYSGEIFLNNNDGSNNFNKLIVEFGYLNLIFIFMFFIFVFKSNLDKRTKVFIFVILVTQLLRGAGYFNGGFLFVTVSGMLSIFINQQKLKNEKN